MEETYEMLARRRVGEAITFLDEHAPPDWRSRVNVEKISMMSHRWCVLGQVYEGQQTGDTDLGTGAYAWARDMLAKRDPGGFDNVRDVFASYDGEWRRQLGGEPQLGGAA